MPILIGDVEVDSLPLLFGDVTNLVEVMNSLTNNYRLLVGAAEELTRTPGAGQQTVNQALDRVDNTGTLLDLVIFTLAVKLDFVAEVLSVTGIPLDLLIAALVKTQQPTPDPEEQLPRDPNNLIPRPNNPYSCRFPYENAAATGEPIKGSAVHNQEKWERRYKQWEARQKKWENRKMQRRRKF